MRVLEWTGLSEFAVVEFKRPGAIQDLGREAAIQGGEVEWSRCCEV